MMRAVSALADTALLAPSSAALLAYLLVWKRQRLAVAFALSLAAGLGGTLLAKLAFHACGSHLTTLDVTSPSGHVSFAFVFYGALATLLAQGRGVPERAFVLAAAAVLLCAIGASRVLVGAHSGFEVAAGAVIGLAGLGVFWLLGGREPSPPLLPFVVAGGAAAAFVVATGSHVTFEHQIAGAARRLTATLDICAPSAGHASAPAAIPLGR